MITAVIFDAFGTLIEILNRENPYKRLLRIGVQQGRVASPSDLRTVMALNGGLLEAAHLFGIKLKPTQLIELQSALDRELESIKCFDDALPAFERLQEHGIKVGVCSNLAGPYCSKVRSLLPGLNAYALSAETGVLKPDPEIYRIICSMLNAHPGKAPGSEGSKVLMIGDSKRCDQLGPRSYGILGHHLDRHGAGQFRSLIEFTNAVSQGIL
ncbi:HAD family hydrolase [Pseudomonas bijieensis]|uniref:HAD family hydrolase n=1 Tax=Pseudomonas bijieensis TaxID=2681983 RepID=A0A6N1C8Z4_9PSED|nr:HAD family hydrolase [Pseudomonas bijieensis]QKS80945.1 HAD family hydrolase [Pseudomonas bijieensis]